MFWFGLILFILYAIETILHVAVTKDAGGRALGLILHLATTAYIGFTLWGGN